MVPQLWGQSRFESKYTVQVSKLYPAGSTRTTPDSINAGRRLHVPVENEESGITGSAVDPDLPISLVFLFDNRAILWDYGDGC